MIHGIYLVGHTPLLDLLVSVLSVLKNWFIFVVVSNKDIEVTLAYITGTFANVLWSIVMFD